MIGVLDMTELIIFLVILSVVALVGTIFVGMQETKRIKKYEAEGDTPEQQLKRSVEYESSSLKSNVPILAIIYIVAILLSIVGLIIYMN